MNPVEPILSYGSAFLGGLLLSLTPCVYPLIPVMVSFIVSLSEGRRLKAFLLSFFYVTGLSTGYSLLGLIASLTGKILGFLSLYPLTYILVGLLIIFFGLWMLEIFKFDYFLKKEVTSSKEKGLIKSFLSSFILGFSNSFLISPCLTPVLGSIMGYLATKQNLFYGITLLFVFGYGLGFILLLSGTFSSILFYLPKSGRWMIYIKNFCGIIILVYGLYFLIFGLIRLIR